MNDLKEKNECLFSNNSELLDKISYLEIKELDFLMNEQIANSNMKVSLRKKTYQGFVKTLKIRILTEVSMCFEKKLVVGTL